MSDSDSKRIDVEAPERVEQHELQVMPVGSTIEVPSLDSTPKLSKRNSSERSLPLRSYSKWSPTEQGATLVWRDLCVYTNVGGSGQRMKRIINNSTGAIQPGTLMALMGSSGSGKTTLMSTLAFRQPAGTVVQGDILINGRRIGPFMHRISGYVYQDDLFLGSLTVLEHLNFMAHLRLDRRVSKEERRLIINELLERTGLLSAAQTRIGSGDDKKVLSGGERKRLAFAVELLNNPVILFCDEPTTGLDSYSAQQLVATLYELAQKGTTILCTIHQPSSQLFDNFNNVMLLADGRVAFTGSPQHALSFFANHGYYCPEAYNPADFLIGVLATDPGYEQASQRSAQHLCDQFAVSSAAKQRDMLVNLEIHMAQSGNFPFDTEVESFRGVAWYKRFHVVWLRASLTLLRDPTIQWLRFIQKIAMAFIIGACFAGTTEPSQLGVQAVQGALFIMISENTYHPMYSVLNLFPQGFPLFMRETRSGLYSTGQYYAANILALLPGMIIEPLIFVIICYWLTGLRSTFYAFGVTAMCVVLVMNVATACGCFFSTAFNSVPLAMAYLVPLDYIFMITSGIFIQVNSLPVAFWWTQFLSWMLYANEAMTAAQWSGVQNITCFQESADLPCFHTGQDVLDKYSFNESNIYRNLLAMVGLYFGFHLLGYYCLWRRARKL
ncbi:protein scarlet [Drosophila simulans]|uniref:GD14642 n=1 Tax=Drosophila simulans TaxID=7240 RepID=B4QMU2_DROSI|nr:protein scarlet [Drosophila simulans]EDX10734.1 GD14642 [Drosophila simulans]KMZ00060.1 scarlet [Drosophila simulans]